METPSFNWDQKLPPGTPICVVSKLGKKKHAETVPKATQKEIAAFHIRSIWDMANLHWHEGAILPSFTINEIHTHFVYLGIRDGAHTFQNILPPPLRRAGSDVFKAENDILTGKTGKKKGKKKGRHSKAM